MTKFCNEDVIATEYKQLSQCDTTLKEEFDLEYLLEEINKRDKQISNKDEIITILNNNLLQRNRVIQEKNAEILALCNIIAEKNELILKCIELNRLIGEKHQIITECINP